MHVLILVQARDDTVSKPINSIIMDNACREAGVPVELHRLQSGGHGFGLGVAGTPSAAWPGWYQDWLGREHLD